MQEFLGVQYETSDQHKEIAESRQKRDKVDSEFICDFLKQRNPFLNSCNEEVTKLQNTVTGVEFPDTVNVYRAKEVGLLLTQSMEGLSIKEFKIKRKDQAITMNSIELTSKEGQVSVADPNLLFQRMLSVLQ